MLKVVPLSTPYNLLSIAMMFLRGHSLSFTIEIEHCHVSLGMRNEFVTAIGMSSYMFPRLLGKCDEIRCTVDDVNTQQVQENTHIRIHKELPTFSCGILGANTFPAQICGWKDVFSNLNRSLCHNMSRLLVVPQTFPGASNPDK